MLVGTSGDVTVTCNDVYTHPDGKSLFTTYYYYHYCWYITSNQGPDQGPPPSLRALDGGPPMSPVDFKKWQVWPLTLKFDRATWSFLKFDRRH